MIKVDWKIPGLPFKIRIPECFNFLFINTCPPETPEEPPKSFNAASITGNSFPSPSTSAAVSSSVSSSSASACPYKDPINWAGDTVFFSMDSPPATSSYGPSTSPSASSSDPGSSSPEATTSTTSTTLTTTTTPVVTNEAPNPMSTVDQATQPPPAATSPASPPSAPPSKDAYCRVLTVKRTTDKPEPENSIEIYGLGFDNTEKQAQAFRDIIERQCYRLNRWVFKVGGEAKGKVWDWTVLGTYRAPQGLDPARGPEIKSCLTKSLKEFGAGSNAGCDLV